MLVLAALALTMLREGPGEIVVVPLGRPSVRSLASVKRALRETYRLRGIDGPPVALPADAYTKPRKRYRADGLLDHLNRVEGDRVIGVTDRDISTTLHGRKDWGIMGLAWLDRHPCVVSSFRAKAGVGKTAVHEIGHTLGRDHCPVKGCLMQDAKGSGKIATNKSGFCRDCRDYLSNYLK
ncbi:hypothetical protein EON81_02240 [bacterium]|nr:MAG: hypothetical protein EON81_02240 [bacterium]